MCVTLRHVEEERDHYEPTFVRVSTMMRAFPRGVLRPLFNARCTLANARLENEESEIRSGAEGGRENEMVQWGTREIVRRLNRFDSLVRPAYCNEHPRDRLISGCGYAALHPVIGESSHVTETFPYPCFFGVLFGWNKRHCEKYEVSFTSRFFYTCVGNF